MGDLNSTVSGTVISSNLVDYLAVTPGQVLVRIDGEDSETEIFTAQQNLEEAQKKLEAAQKNLDNCNAVAPIDGTVMGLALTPGQELEANTTVIQIAGHLQRGDYRQCGRAEHQLYQDRNVREPGPVGHQRLRHGGDGEPFQHRE